MAGAHGLPAAHWTKRRYVYLLYSLLLSALVSRKIIFADLPALQSSLLYTHTMPSTMFSGENGNLMHHNYAKLGSDLNSLHTEILFCIACLL